jgi:hypothetical protein
MFGGGENIVVDSAQKILIEDCWFNHNNLSNEYHTWDENPYKSYNDTIRRCVFVNGAHNDIMWDLWWFGLVENCYFTSNNTSDYSCLYNHVSENSGTNDTVGHYCMFRNLTLYSKSAVWTWGGSWSTTDTVKNISIKNTLVRLASGTAFSSDPTRMHGCTIDSVVFVNNNTIGNTWTVADTFNNRGKDYLCDTTYGTYFPYHKHSSKFAGKSSHKYLTNLKQMAYNVGQTTFTVSDSIAKDFRHDNLYRAENVINNNHWDSLSTYNTWYAGDSVITRLMITIDTMATWVEADKDTTKAGQSEAFTYSSGIAATKYFYRIISDNTEFGLHDTTLIYSVTTLSSSPVITVQPTSQTVDENNPVTFSLTATGADSYQWSSKNHGNVGSSSNTYTFSPPLTDNGDTIWCTVSNSNGSTASNKVRLTVNDTIITSIVDTPKIEFIPLNHIRMPGGDTIYVYGKKFGVSPSINSGTIIFSNDSMMKVITATQSAGNFNLIVTNGTQKDTAIIVYDSPKNSDTVYVDLQLTKTYDTYNPLTKDSLSGTKKAYFLIQKAIDSTAAGMTIMLRTGTYRQNHIRLWTTKNGTSWERGCYNTIQSYPGEWAIIDGGDSVYNRYSTNPTLFAPLIGSAGGGVNAPVKYWKLLNIEITGGRSKFYDEAAGFFADGGPFVISNCYIHNNRCLNGSNNPTGIGGYGWVNCIVENCWFHDNGSINASTNSADLTMYGDYRHYARDTMWAYTGFNYTTEYVQSRNIFRYNLFTHNKGHAIKYKGGQIFTGRNPAHGQPYKDTYKLLGDDIHHNVFTNIEELAVRPKQDFVQVHHNIFDSCGAAIGSENDGMEIYKGCFYNNTIRRPVTDGIALEHSYFYPDSYGQNNYFSFADNNLADSGQSWYAGASIGSHRNSADVNATFDSLKINRCLFTRQKTSASDATATRPFFIGNNVNGPSPYLTIDEFKARYVNFLNWLKTDDVFLGNTGAIRYKTNGSYIINEGTTIANGGTGGNHPFLPGVTMPLYIGAADPINNSWVDDVLALKRLGVSTSPEIDSIRPATWYYGKRITIYGRNLTNSMSISLGDSALGAYEFSSSSMIIDTIPVGMPSGSYRFSINGTQLGNAVRVFRPRWGW